MAISQEIYQAVSPVFQAHGVPDYVWLSIGDMETGGTFNPKTLGDNGRSFGIFQLFTAGGQGDAYAGNPTVLYDPQLNAQVAAPAISQAYWEGKMQGIPEGPELAAYTAANSGHPGYGLAMSYPAVAIVRERASTYFNQGVSTAKNWWEDLGQGIGNLTEQIPDWVPWGWVPKFWGKVASGDTEDTPISKEWWQRMGIYVLAVIIALMLIWASVQAIVKPGRE